jgi:hypothetical protein
LSFMMSSHFLLLSNHTWQALVRLFLLFLLLTPTYSF